MNWSFSLVRVKGIDIRVHATFALILVWAAFYWGTQVDAGGRGALFGVVATLLLFACVALHELGHSLMARRYGIEVEDITLLPIGGVARLEVPENPKQEFWIAVAGPAVNIVIAIILIAVGAILQETSVVTPSHLVDSIQNAEWSGLLPYLISANLWLVAFNAIPAFPMDGGRILRAALATRIGYRRATSIAVTLGQGLALVFGVIGFITGDLFLLVIAVFVWLGAASEGEQVIVRSVLNGVAVKDALTPGSAILVPTDPVARAVQLTLSTYQSDFPVITGHGRVVGLLTAEQLMRALRDRPTELVGDVMRRDIPTLAPDEPLSKAQARLIESGVRALPVIAADGNMIGMLTLNDIAEAYRLLSIRPELRTTRAPDNPNWRLERLDEQPVLGSGRPAGTSESGPATGV